MPLITMRAKIRLISQKPGDRESTYTTAEGDFDYDVADPDHITPNDIQEKLIAKALSHPDLVAQRYSRQDVAVLEFEAFRVGT